MRLPPRWQQLSHPHLKAVQGTLLASFVNSLDRRRRVVTEDAINVISVLGEWKPHPEQHNMVAALDRSGHDAVERHRLLRYLRMDLVPVVCASAGKDAIDPLASDFLAIHIAQPCSGQPEPRSREPFGQVDQADTGKELWDTEGVDVGTGWHCPCTSGLAPIVEKIALTLRHQLRPKWASGPHQSPLLSPWAGLANHPVNHDYARFGCHSQVSREDSRRVTISCGDLLTVALDLAGLTREPKEESAATKPAALVKWSRPCLSSALAEAHTLGEIGPRGSIVRSDHWIVVRKAPFLPVLLGRKLVMRPQVPLQRFEFFTVL